MIPLATIRELYDYNFWARDRQLAICRTLTQDQFLRPMGSSYSSLRDTLVHLVGGEWIWLEAWLGRSPAPLPKPEDFTTVPAIEEFWRPVEANMRAYLDTLTDERLAKPFSYESRRGGTWTYPLWRTLFHIINHQSYHRGQVTTLLRQLGAQPLQIDFLVAHDVGFRP